MAIEIRNITKSYGSKRWWTTCLSPSQRGKLRLLSGRMAREEYGAVYYEPFVEC